MSAPVRLSALDAAFVALDSPDAPFVIGSVLVLDRRLDLHRLRAYTEAALALAPRYRQRLGRIPVLGHPVWIDDERFAIEQHVLEIPPDLAAGGQDVPRTAAALLTRGLPPGRAPWQLWLMDLPGGRSALIAVVHHALVDGVSGMRLLQQLTAPDTSAAATAAVPAPQPRPARRRLLAGELRHRVGELRALARGLAHPAAAARAMSGLLRQGLNPASDIGLNPRHTGPRRAIAIETFDLDDVALVRAAFGVTMNDVLLAVVTGALRALLAGRGVAPDAQHDVRAMVPASTAAPGDQAIAGNRVAMLLAPLPVDQPDPVRRLQRIAAATRALKSGAQQKSAGELMTRLSDATTPRLLAGVLRLGLARRGFNLVVTNVPGPPEALALLGARVESITPIVNLWPHQALAVAALSYAGRLQVGVHADRAVVPDLAPFAGALSSAFAELVGAARAHPVAA
jgi:WS/DGAT/MGAT family acyltransferase